jgi:transcriptional regulator PpsR
LGNLDAEAAGTLIAAASDVALILDDAGVIHDIAFQSDDLAKELDDPASWLGRAWIETVTIESRPKIEQLLRDAESRGEPRWRQVNHPTASGPDVPVMYSTMPIGKEGRLVAFGRDMRAISVLQQRLVDAQQSMERDYSRLRHVETRYRVLFQMSSEAVLIVDSVTLRVTEANPAAVQMFEGTGPGLPGRALADAFDEAGARAVQSLLATVRTASRADNVGAGLRDGRQVVVSASLFRQESHSLFLVRLSLPPAEHAPTGLARLQSKLLKLVESAPDGFVVTDEEGRVVTANAAFVELAEMASQAQMEGESLDRWVGRPGVELDVLMANLRQRGSVRLFATTVRGEYGSTAEVEISAVTVMNGGQPCFGFAIRNVGRRLNVDSRNTARAGRELPRSVEQLTELIGRVSLKDLVRETTDVVERMCIEAALELTGDNRASAAEMLGLSRQSLYVKLRRYGLGDLAAEGRE